MGKYNISANIVRTNEQLYDKAISAVHMNNNTEKDWIRTTVGVRQERLVAAAPSPTPSPSSTFFLERILTDDLKEHDGKFI